MQQTFFALTKLSELRNDCKWLVRASETIMEYCVAEMLASQEMPNYSPIKLRVRNV